MTVPTPTMSGTVIQAALQPGSHKAARRLAVRVLAEHAHEFPGPVLADLLDRIIGLHPWQQFGNVVGAMDELAATQRVTARWTDMHAALLAIVKKERVLEMALDAAVANA